MKILGGLITSIRTLTILPVPGRDSDKLSSALFWFPVTGLLLGSILCGIVEAISWLHPEPWAEGVAVIVLLFSIVLTRGLHLDGLSDWADGFWGSTDREKVLRIMKDPTIGSFGAAALTIFLLAKWIFLTRIISSSSPALYIITAYVLSRTMQAVLASSFSYARANGGTGEAFIKDAGPRHRVSVLAIALVILMVIGWRNQTSAALLATAWLITILFGKYSAKRIGGITGDVLGACSEIIETSTLAACAFMA